MSNPSRRATVPLRVHPKTGVAPPSRRRTRGRDARATHGSGRTLGQWVSGMLLTGACLVVSGCNLTELTKQLLIQAAPTTEEVPAEFNRLSGKTVLVYVWVHPEIRWSYPNARLELAGYLSGYLKKNVKHVGLVDYYQVESYLEKASSFEMDPSQPGRHFNADMVVHLAVHHFSLRDPEMAHFYRGRIGAAVAVIDLSHPDESPEQIPLGEVEVAVPEEGAIGFANRSPAEVRQLTYYAFTEKVGRKFHAYKREVD